MGPWACMQQPTSHAVTIPYITWPPLHTNSFQWSQTVALAQACTPFFALLHQHTQIFKKGWNLLGMR